MYKALVEILGNLPSNTVSFSYLMVISVKQQPLTHLRGCDHMLVGFTTTYAISAYHH